ncbi:TraC family protein [Sphingomonas sp. PL-96]|nr:TraC family protein [Sphingomonas sp. PL-96]
MPRLVQWLPYRSYDPKTQIFYNSASRGFVLEAASMLGTNAADPRFRRRVHSERHSGPYRTYPGWRSARA